MERVGALFGKAQILFTIRNQIDYVVSVYLNILRNYMEHAGVLIPPFDIWYWGSVGQYRSQALQNVDFSVAVRRYRERFGAENIEVLPLEFLETDGVDEYRLRVARFLQIPEETIDPTWFEQRENDSPADTDLAAYEAHASPQMRRRIYDMAAQGENFFEKMRIANPAGKRAIIDVSEDIRAHIGKTCGVGNAWLAKTFDLPLQMRWLPDGSPAVMTTSDPKKTAIVHIGMHKTGSTSLQFFLNRHRGKLRKAGIDFFEGAYLPENHLELHAATMRPERMSPFKIMRNIEADDAFCDEVKRRTTAFVRNSSASRLLFSAEGISYLRYPDEMAALKSLLDGVPARLAIFVREKASWLASYRAQMKSFPPPTSKGEFNYTQDDTWLLDFDERIDRFRQAFGKDSVLALSYDDAVAADGSIIPAFLRYLGVIEHFSPDDWNGIFMNRRSPD